MATDYTTSTTSPNNNHQNAALVFGASGEQGRAVIEGFVDAGFYPVYGFTSNSTTISDQYLSDALQCVLLEGKLGNPDDVRKALISTRATTIFVTTTTDMTDNVNNESDAKYGPSSGGFQTAQDDEYFCIQQFFDILRKVYLEDHLERTIIFSTRDDVQELCRVHLEQTGQVWIEPLDDGSIVPHYSAKGRGGKEALKMLSSSSSSGDVDHNDYAGLNLILLTMPFFYSNFLAFFVPLPNKGQTQWELSASFGDGAIPIDMMNCSDLGQLVVNVAKQSHKYKGQNLRIAAERISMDEIAKQFSELFGKDVIYNPLLPSEVAGMEFPTAPAIAQMCQFLSSNSTTGGTSTSDDGGINDEQQKQQRRQGGLYEHHDVELTRELMGGRKPSKFSDWLLTHSDSTAFSRVGLDRDAPELTRICVFGALSPQGKSVIRGLLADTRKKYEIRATTRKDFTKNPDAQELINLAPQQVSFVHADFDDVSSCHKAVEGMDGAFLVADLHHGDDDDDTSGNSNAETEERHVRNIIDACEGTVKHLVFSTMESSDAVNKELPQKELLEFSPKARVASYARSKQLSVTFVLMPCYSEVFFDMMDVRKSQNNNGKDKLVLQIPAGNNNSGNNGKVMCMSVDELGPAVANIFDSYECFAGHEIGLVTDFVTVSEVQEIFQDVFTDHTVETETVDTKNWIEARGTYMKDLGQLFAGVSHSDPVRSRHSVAKTFKLVPSATNLRRWVEQNKENPAFREKLGLR